MAAWTLRFDGAGLFGFRFLKSWRPLARSTATPAERAPARREVSMRRAEAMRGLFPKLSAWMARQAYLAEMNAVDRYLTQSTDLVDLERRLREVERSGGASNWVG